MVRDNVADGSHASRISSVTISNRDVSSSDFEFSRHARDMLQERNIPEEWVWRTLQSPEYTSVAEDETIHHVKAIPEFGGRLFRVVVNPHQTSRRVVTFFFDRRIRMLP